MSEPVTMSDELRRKRMNEIGMFPSRHNGSRRQMKIFKWQFYAVMRELEDHTELAYRWILWRMNSPKYRNLRKRAKR
jgi:hypothetical protein